MSWYPATITEAPADEPVTVDDLKRQIVVEESDDDALLERLIKSARSHVENYTGLWLVEQTITAKCDAFSDLRRLPFAPLQTLSSISYVDVDGADQTVSTSIYEVRVDGLDASIVLKFNQQWPVQRRGSRITVTAVVGYDDEIPPSISHAMLMLIAFWYAKREAATIESRETAIVTPLGFDDLLVNFRIGV